MLCLCVGECAKCEIVNVSELMTSADIIRMGTMPSAGIAFHNFVYELEILFIVFYLAHSRAAWLSAY